MSEPTLRPNHATADAVRRPGRDRASRRPIRADLLPVPIAHGTRVAVQRSLPNRLAAGGGNLRIFMRARTI